LCDLAQALRLGQERFVRRVPVAQRFQHLLQLEERMGFVHAFRPLGAERPIQLAESFGARGRRCSGEELNR